MMAMAVAHTCNVNIDISNDVSVNGSSCTTGQLSQAVATVCFLVKERQRVRSCQEGRATGPWGGQATPALRGHKARNVGTHGHISSSVGAVG